MYRHHTLEERTLGGKGVYPRVLTVWLYSINRSAILKRSFSYTRMQKLSKSKVHTWGIVGAGFLANCAPTNYIGINILTAKGAQGHTFFNFCYMENAL